MRNIQKGILAVALLLASQVNAATPYFGVSAGNSSPEESGFKDSTGFKLYAGSMLTQFIGLEAAYTRLGEFDADNDALYDISRAAGATVSSASIEVDGFEFSFLGNVPLGEKAAMFIRAGVFMWDAEVSVSLPYFGSGKDTEDGTDPFFGVGFSVNPNENFSIVFEYDRYEADEADIDYMSLGARFFFK
jgi:hypothetical protein